MKWHTRRRAFFPDRRDVSLQRNRCRFRRERNHMSSRAYTGAGGHGVARLLCPRVGHPQRRVPRDAHRAHRQGRLLRKHIVVLAVRPANASLAFEHIYVSPTNNALPQVVCVAWSPKVSAAARVLSGSVDATGAIWRLAPAAGSGEQGPHGGTLEHRLEARSAAPLLRDLTSCGLRWHRSADATTPSETTPFPAPCCRRVTPRG